MIRKIRLCGFTISVCTLFIGLPVPLAQSKLPGVRQKSVEQGYFLISNVVENENRDIHVLLNDVYFSEEYLLAISKALFERYPEPDRLDIWLYSSTEQVRYFVDGRPYHGAQLIVESNDPTFWDRHARALLFRADGNEVIRYHVPGGLDASPETIVIKGRDPAFSSHK